MDKAADNKRLGHYVTSSVTGEKVRAYVPAPLPPIPPLQISSLQILLEQANQAIGRLDGFASALTNLDLFIYAYVRKEAVLSSQIEGTQSSLSDLLFFENDEIPGVPLHDVQEVSNYVAALNHGIKRLRGGFPLSLRLIKETHKILLSKGRGGQKQPGEFRRSQNWIGGSRPGNAAFVPPPPEKVMECLGALELFLHEDHPELPLLLKVGLVHVQFETIHPFLDGNGRVGRLLITLLLCAEGAMREPILYLSLYFKKYRSIYYEKLNAVRIKGDWEGWLDFFLQGIRDTANQAAETARKAGKLFEKHLSRIESLGRNQTTVQRVYNYAQSHPVFSIKNASAAIGISFPTTSGAVAQLESLGILRETTGRQRNRLFIYISYLALLNQDIEEQSLR